VNFLSSIIDGFITCWLASWLVIGLSTGLSIEGSSVTSIWSLENVNFLGSSID
jgi:hypothetical protein